MNTLRFTGFTLLEYLRSGRFAVEAIATIVVYFVFLRRVTQEMTAEYVFTVLSIYTPVLTLYTTSIFIGIGDRPAGYVLLNRGVSRAAYLLGLFFSSLTIVGGSYGLLCIGLALFNRPIDLDLGGWMLGTLPVLLNIGLLSALLLLLSPIVCTIGWRLFILGLIALGFSSNFIGGPLLETMPDSVRGILSALQAALGGPLVPAMYGVSLAITRDYSTMTAVANLAAQFSLLISLLGLAIYAFSRRDLLFST
jgi:hypothetical protein